MKRTPHAPLPACSPSSQPRERAARGRRTTVWTAHALQARCVCVCVCVCACVCVCVYGCVRVCVCEARPWTAEACCEEGALTHVLRFNWPPHPIFSALYPLMQGPFFHPPDNRQPLIICTGSQGWSTSLQPASIYPNRIPPASAQGSLDGYLAPSAQGGKKRGFDHAFVPQQQQEQQQQQVGGRVLILHHVCLRVCAAAPAGAARVPCRATLDSSVSAGGLDSCPLRTHHASRPTAAAAAAAAAALRTWSAGGLGCEGGRQSLEEESSQGGAA